MFKAIIFGACVLAVAMATEVERLDNIVEYGLGEQPFRGLAMPYPYQENQNERVLIKPLLPEVLVPAVPAVAAVGSFKLGLIAKVAATAIAVVKKTFFFIIANAPGLIIGILAAFGICKFTPFCDKFSSYKSLLTVPIELRSYATPERLAKATDFVKTAIRKYRSLQDED